MNTHTLTIAFSRPTEKDDWVNRLTAKVSKHPVCHVELHFDLIDQCFSIVWKDKASFKAKSLANPNYDLISLSVPRVEYESALSFCKSAASSDMGFDDYGMWTSFFNLGCLVSDSRTRRATFCSKIITEALQFAGIQEVQHLRPSFTTPSRLYEAVCGSNRRVCNSCPFKRYQMVANGQVPLVA